MEWPFLKGKAQQTSYSCHPLQPKLCFFFYKGEQWYYEGASALCTVGKVWHINVNLEDSAWLLGIKHWGQFHIFWTQGLHQEVKQSILKFT